MDIEKDIRVLAEKWKYAQSEASDLCMKAAEEIRILRKEVELLRQLDKERKSIAPSSFVLGWGKGKDE